MTQSFTTLEVIVTEVSNGELADMPTQTIKGRATAGTGDPEDLTSAQATAILDTFTTTQKGLVPPSGGGTTNFLRADGTFAPPAVNLGTVTSVSITTANGVSGTVATPTTTPAISITLGAITPSSVAATGSVTGSNLSGTNTGDQTTITGNAGTATALQTARNIDSTPFDGTASILVVAPAINAAPSKAAPVDADKFGIWNSVGGLLAHTTWANIKAALTPLFQSVPFISTVQTITPAGALVIAHGLGVTPTFVTVALVNQVAEHGYSIGDKVETAAGQSGKTNNAGVAITKDATNIYIRYGAGSGGTAPVFGVLNKTTGADAAITNANWKAQFLVHP